MQSDKQTAASLAAATTPMSRRSFVAGSMTAGALAAASLAGAGSALASESEDEEASSDVATPSFLDAPDPIDDSEISQTYEADVVVVGLGLAGVAAARSAAEAGLSVVAIERSSAPNSRSSQFAVFNSDNARAMGIDDIDTTELVNELMIQMGHRPDARVLKTWADNCGEAFDWYVGAKEDATWVHPGESAPEAEDAVYVSNGNIYEPYQYGLDHEKIFTGTLSIRPSGHAPVLTANYDAAVATGNLTAIFDMRGLQLTKDEERVSGVIAQSITDQSYIKVSAAKAVILATGGYLHNDEMLAYYLPWIYNQQDKFAFSYMSVDANAEKVDVGDGHRMGYWAGGNIEEGPHAAMAHGDLGKLGVNAFLQLNAHGERYINEDLTNDHFGSAIVRQPDALIYQIFDANWTEQLASMQAGLGTVHSTTQETIDTIDEWTSAQGETIEELIANLGVEDDVAATMQSEIARYNELCELGKDEDFGKAAERMFALATPPFYAIRYQVGGSAADQSTLRCLVSMSGLSTNKNAQVLNSSFDVVPGLFAVGNVQGGRFLGDYPTTIAGMSHSIALTYGYLAGKYVSENL